MDTKLLKQKILDLAIRGKLVPQDPNDEPASVLLERIRTEREKLIAEGKLKRSKNTSDNRHYKNVPFEIPDSWEWQTLGDIGKWQAGGTPNRGHKEYYGGDIPWLKTGDLNDGYITEIPEHITQAGLENSSAKLNPKDSVLVALYGATIGKVGILTFPATTNQACCACIDYPSLDKLYLFYYLRQHRNVFISQGGGGAQPNISKEIITATFIPVPPYEEQKRIVEEIERWFILIDNLEESKDDLQNTIKQTKSKILDLAIHGKLVEQDPNDEPASELLKRIAPNAVICDSSQYTKLPRNWCTAPMECICESVASKNYQIKQSAIKPSGKYPVISQSVNFIEGYSDEEGKPFRVSSPIIIFGDHTRIVKYIGFDFIVGADGVKILKPLLSPKYFYYLTLYVATHIKDRGYGRHYGYLSRFLVPIPPQKEQERIAHKLEELYKSLDEMTTEL